MEKAFTIIKGCKDGYPKYQKIFYERYRGAALKIVFRYIYNYEEALEIVNDGFVKFFKNIDKFRCENDTDLEKVLNGWIKRIMINTSIDLLRKKMLLPEIGGIPEYVWNVEDKSSSPDQAMIYKDLMIMVKQLPPVYRIVFNMHVIDGYTHIEIADILKMPVGTSKSNLQRAKLLMQNYLNQREELNECRI
ncbi:MAG: RNA polymerase sigma factor [Ferruginibacter sp.]